ncbi:MAG: YicC family protein [Christensenellaceae bacterium]|jgi:uncharacterized protein (TIGR00255 family)|nr:YicC family protein [Christensenellaceae bacterium]
MFSMTGYGKGIAERDGNKATVELRSVNHRYLDLSVKCPRGLQFLEDPIKKRIATCLSRGHIEAVIAYDKVTTNNVIPILDEGLATAYLQVAKKLESLGYQNNLGVAEILRFPEMVTLSVADNYEEEITSMALEALDLALAQAIDMRRSEGSKLISDIKSKLADIKLAVSEISQLAPLVSKEYKERLTARINELTTKTLDIDDTRLANEVAFFVDKYNIDEELTRLNGHIAHYNEIFSQSGAIGRKLDFLTQEMNRESNTIASKANNAEITKRTLYIKNLIEMMREQIQNIE